MDSEIKICTSGKEIFPDDVDGTLVQRYNHANGVITVKNDIQVDALYVLSDFDLLTYFNQ